METSGTGKRKIDAICVETVNDGSLSSCASTTKYEEKESPAGSDPFKPHRTAISQAKSPEYTIYCDQDIDLAAKAGNIPTELRHRIVRGTINNMISTAFNPPWSRMPTTSEVMEMAKSLVVTFPQLCDDATKHPVEKKQGPNKKVKKEIVEKEDEVEKNKDDEVHEEELKSPGCENSDEPFSQQIMDRHYNALVKAMQKGKPSPTNINLYLNKEFEGRRSRVQNMAAEDRHMELFEAYPCFKNHVEIIEEVRRILGKEEQDKPDSFMKECIKRLQNEIDFLIYFGVSKKSIGHPSKPTSTAKIVHIMKHVHTIFGGASGKTSRNTRKPIHLVYVIKDNEDPEQCCSRKQGNGLKMLIDSTTAYIICNGSILVAIQLDKVMEAALAFIGMFYVLDIDYPPSHELGLTVLHSFMFGDKSTPAELLTPFNTAIEEYMKFKNCA